MPLIKLLFRPGVNRDQTDYSAEGGWYECDKIRFRSGFPEKIGGWRKVTTTPFYGVCRQMWNWITTFQDNLLALGTNNKVYLETPGGSLYDITPLRASNPVLSSPGTDNCVGTTDTSATVTIDLGATPHGASTGDFVTLSGVVGSGSPQTIGGILVTDINSNHQITVLDAYKFTFAVSTAATSTTSAQGGTSIDIAFEITAGVPTLTEGYGWGAGVWGGYYAPVPSPLNTGWGSDSRQPINIPQRDWWFDNIDNDLVMNIRNGVPYYWERGSLSNPTTALATRAIRLSAYADDNGFDPTAVPTKVMQLMVAQQARILIAFGATPYGETEESTFDPLLIRWAAFNEPGDWEISSFDPNGAGYDRVSRGSRIVRALPTRQEILVWTDTSLYALQFTGTLPAFQLQEYADNISVMSPRAMATAAGVTYWMGQDKFYAYSGVVNTLPCTLRNHVFMNINTSQSDQIVCGTNEQWNEVWWFYPTANSNYNNAYVVYNHLEQVWYYGTIERTAWLDTPLRHWPQAANTLYTNGAFDDTGNLYNHEDGIDADDAPMTSYIQSNDFDIEDGEQFMLTRRVIPDIGFSGSNFTDNTPAVTLELRYRNFPGSALRTGVEDTAAIASTSVDAYTAQVFIRARARQMALKIMSENLGTQWQLGSPRLDARQDGKR